MNLTLGSKRNNFGESKALEEEGIALICKEERGS